MDNHTTLQLRLRSQGLGADALGHACWDVRTITKAVPAAETAIIICDMWDNHWSRGAAERAAAMAPRMNQVVLAARARGVQIIHAPSDTMDFYAGTPARQRMIDAPRVDPPEPLAHPDPPLP